MKPEETTKNKEEVKNEQKIVEKEAQIKTPTEKDDSFAVFIFQKNQFYCRVGNNIYLPYIKGAEENQKIVFDEILLRNKDIGTPFVAGAKVIAEVKKPDHKDKKIIIFKYKSKKNYRRKTGHRQHYTIVKIKEIK